MATAGVTCRLLTTVRTPSTCAASLAAALRAASLLTFPERVTTPLLALIESCLSGTLPSELILLWTSAATCASGRLLLPVQPTANSARQSGASHRYLRGLVISTPVLVAYYDV